VIGVFDSGSGGLTILSALRTALPHHDFLYMGDHARAPYGHRSNADIVAYTREAVDHLMRQGCQLVVVACNTAAAVALRSLQQNWLATAWPGRRLLGVLVPMVETVTGLPWHSLQQSDTARDVLLFATRKTVESGAYLEEIAKRAPHIQLYQKACPGLVDAIEGGAGVRPTAGLVSGFVADALSEMNARPDAVVLGCTHFPLVENLFAESLAHQLGHAVSIYAQPKLVADSLIDYLSRHPEAAATGAGDIRLLTTAAPASISHPLALGNLPQEWQQAEL